MGLFIVIEGIDGSGKTTQARLLYSFLREKGLKVELTEEPSRHITGLALKGILRSREILPPETYLLLFLADRIAHTSLTIKPLLKEDYIVISDRYHYSTLAYQTAKGITPSSINNILKSLSVDLPKPDLAILIDVSPETAIKRMGKRNVRGIYEELEFLKKVREAYLSMDLIRVNGERPIHEIQEDIRNLVQELIG